MYSGSTLTRYSGRVLGSHQKIDRIARRHLELLSEGSQHFPPISMILHFEGKNGPDAIKRKSPSKDEPWHWYDPYDEDDSNLLEVIQGHYRELVSHLKSANMERAAFEAAWLSHAIVDGLTPAHHFPFEEHLHELRGEGLHTRDSVIKKNVLPGSSPLQMLQNNWKYWGPKGLFMTHGLFELGLATIIAPMRLTAALPTLDELHHFYTIGSEEWYKHAARRIASHNMYERFYQFGWTPALARIARREVAPEMVRTVNLYWFQALCDAGRAPRPFVESA